ncbi:MAG TPA: M48 family metallopeptidase [Methanoculleus sp.]|nr:M48 family metallopeptidase [Methanoculleus sp.]
MARERLTDLDSCEYEHPFDRQALATLEATPGLDIFIQKMFEHIGDDYHRILLTGSAVKATDRVYPDLFNTFKETCEVLEIERNVDLFITGGDINAFAIGVEYPIVVLNTVLIDAMTDEELVYIIGHELGHIKSRHLLYHTTASILSFFGSQVGDLFFGVGDLLLTAVQYPIQHWSRMSEFTADRAGLLACQDIDAAIRANMKLAGVPIRLQDQISPDEFIRQAEEFDYFDYQNRTSLIKVLVALSNNMSHPWVVTRAAELKKWVDTGDYGKVLKRETRLIQVPPMALLCRRCSYQLAGGEMFCPNCGLSCQIAPPEPDGSISFCSACGHQLTGHEAFCPNCGCRHRGLPGQQVTHACDNCGHLMQEIKDFCPMCGTDLRETSQSINEPPKPSL